MIKIFNNIKHYFGMRIQNFFYNVKIKKKLIVITILVVLISVLALGVTLFKISKNDLIKAENSSIEHSTSQLTDVFDFYLEEIVNKSDYLMRDDKIQEKFIKNYENTADVIDMYNYVNKALLPIIFEVKYPNVKYSRFTLKDSKALAITIYSNNDTLRLPYDSGDGIFIKDINTIKGEQWYREFSNSKSSFFWRDNFKKVENGKDVFYISLNRKFLDLNTMEEIGILSIEINVEAIREILKDRMLDLSYGIYLIKPNGTVIIKNETSQLYNRVSSKIILSSIISNKKNYQTIKVSNKNYRVFSNTSEMSSWKLIIIVNNQSIVNGVSRIAIVTIIICLVSLSTALILMLILSRSITGRLSLLISKINIMSQDTYQPLIEIKGQDEIGEVDTQFNKMIFKINDLIDSEYKTRLDAKRIEVELLQEQMNPHLLYNSLTAIRYITKKHNIESAFDITESLIKFYKATLNKGNIFIRFSEEMNIVDEYISLTKKVYGLDIELYKDIDHNIYQYHCIKLLLQPAVENAILHGIRPTSVKGVIEITGKIENECILLEVADNGEGMDEQTLEKIMDFNGIGEIKGFGLYNVNRRIKLFYGENYGIAITSKLGQGTRVKMLIPCSDFYGDYKNKN